MLAHVERAIVPVVFMLALLILWPVLRQMWVAAVYDDSPPAVIHAVTIHTPTIPVGGTMEWTTIYSKRVDCSPPQGRGEVRYRIVGSPGSDKTRHNIYDLDLSREARWPPGNNLTFRSSLAVPDDIPPGSYLVLNIASYDCAGASRPLSVTPAPMPLEIVPRP